MLLGDFFKTQEMFFFRLHKVDYLCLILISWVGEGATRYADRNINRKD